MRLKSNSILIVLLTCLFWGFWFQWIVLNPLRIRAIEMKHLDPSEIIAVPYELKPLSVYVGGGVAVLCCILRRNVLSDFARTSATMLLVIFLCGGNVFHHFLSSILAAVHAATVLFFWYFATSGNPSSNVVRSLIKEQVFNVGMEKHKNKRHHVLETVVPFYIMLSIIMFYQILHILDWGIQMQRWPLPIVSGCTVGYTVSTAVRIMVQVVLKYSIPPNQSLLDDKSHFKALRED